MTFSTLDSSFSQKPNIHLSIGSPAPLFSLPDGYEKTISLADFLKPRGVLIAFIHGTWCPDCMRGVASLRRTFWFVKRVQVNTLVITRQEVHSLSAFILSQKSPPPFPILADHSGEVFRSYGLTDEQDLHGAKASFFVDNTGTIKKINNGLKFGPLTPFG